MLCLKVHRLCPLVPPLKKYYYETEYGLSLNATDSRKPTTWKEKNTFLSAIRSPQISPTWICLGWDPDTHIAPVFPTARLTCNTRRCARRIGLQVQRPASALLPFLSPQLVCLLLNTGVYLYSLRKGKIRPASWSSGQSLWLLIMRSRFRFPALPWEFSLKGKIPAVTMVWVD